MKSRGLRGFLIGVGYVVCLVPWGCAEPRSEPAREEDPKIVRSAECQWATTPIRIDGKADEGAWANAVEIKDFAAFWAKRPARSATRARLLWDEDNLYFTAEMEDTDLYADIKERNGMIWNNDVFELFFKPSEKSLSYYEFQVSPANTQLELFFPSRGSGGYQRFAPLTKLGMESAVRLDGTLNNWEDKDVGWTVEGRIPWSAFKAAGGRPKAGDRWRFALCRYDYSAAYERPDLSSCAPLTVCDFHRYEDYAELVFVGPRK